MSGVTIQSHFFRHWDIDLKCQGMVMIMKKDCRRRWKAAKTGCDMVFPDNIIKLPTTVVWQRPMSYVD